MAIVKGRDVLISLMILNNFDTDKVVADIKDNRDLEGEKDLPKRLEEFHKEYDCITILDEDYKSYPLLHNEVDGLPNLVMRWERASKLDIRALARSNPYNRVALVDDINLYTPESSRKEIILCGLKMWYRPTIKDGEKINECVFTVILHKDHVEYPVLTTFNYMEAVRFVSELCASAVIANKGYKVEPAGTTMDDILRAKFVNELTKRKLPALCGVIPGKHGCFANSVLKRNINDGNFFFCDCWSDIIDIAAQTKDREHKDEEK